MKTFLTSFFIACFAKKADIYLHLINIFMNIGYIHVDKVSTNDDLLYN